MREVRLSGAAFAVGALCLHIFCMEAASEARNCSALMKAHAAESGWCGRDWPVLTRICHFEDGGCRTKGAELCNLTVQSMLAQASLRHGLVCSGEEPCTFLHLLASHCQTANGPHSLAESRPPGCLSALQSCMASHRCASPYERMEESCRPGRGQCGTAAGYEYCLALWERLRRTPLSNCTCGRARRKCLAVQQIFQKKPCVQDSQEGVQPGLSPVTGFMPQYEQGTPPKAKWQDSSLAAQAHATNRSCFQRMRACVEDKVCNRWLVPLVQACPPSQCVQTLCETAVRQFYSGAPEGVAEALFFCTCDRGDQACQLAEASLHGGTCGGQEVWTCLEMLDGCLQNPACSQKFEDLTSRCLGIEPDLHAGLDAGGWPDLVGDERCRAALVATAGSRLQRPCSCDGLHGRDLHKCHALQQVLHNKSWFMKSSRADSSPAQPSPIYTSPNGEWWFRGGF
ncbi:GDNF family receptor alpha-2 [Denticeps clupeoides]|uniref:GDNF family receptor alpha-2 n=1 Tax=Denticeps clupeoides TaxID=299321 RepID=UPI0010A2D292|nr:GDNF family receptor alpha-like [Denticeps clupeoides]